MHYKKLNYNIYHSYIIHIYKLYDSESSEKWKGGCKKNNEMLEILSLKIEHCLFSVEAIPASYERA